LTSSGGIEDEFEVVELEEGVVSEEGTAAAAAAGDEGRTRLGGSVGEDLEEDVVDAAEGIEDLFFGGIGSREGGADLLEPAAAPVFCDVEFFDFFAFARTGEERCNCRTETLATTGLERTRDNTIHSQCISCDKGDLQSLGGVSAAMTDWPVFDVLTSF
jgi:hypothetical protein